MAKLASALDGSRSLQCALSAKVVRDKIRSNVHPKRTFVGTTGMSAKGQNIAAQIGNVRITPRATKSLRRSK
jgi:hypothetical protein